MTKRLFTLIVPVILLVIILSGCTKNNGIDYLNNKCTWTYKGVTHTAYTDTAFSYGQTYPNTIIAAQGNTLRSFPRCEFVVSSFSPDGYSFNTGGINFFRYYDEQGNMLEATQGGINITANSDKKMSGNFSATLTNSSGVSNQINGRFDNIPVYP